MVVDAMSPAVEFHQAVASCQLTAQEFLPLGVAQSLCTFDVIDRDDRGCCKDKQGKDSKWDLFIIKAID